MDARLAASVTRRCSARFVGVTAELVRRALDDMAATYRDVLLLRAVDLSEGEIANRLGASVANVEIRTRARRQLRQLLQAS